MQIAASVGIARSPLDGADAGTLMRKADIAMYRVKRMGFGWALYRPDEDDVAAERIRLIADLREAIADEQLHVAFQPTRSGGAGRLHRTGRAGRPQRVLPASERLERDHPAGARRSPARSPSTRGMRRLSAPWSTSPTGSG